MKRKNLKPSRNGDAAGLQWLFPSNELGQDFGIHDAGVETFRGDYYRYLAREIIQNSLDAHNPVLKKPVRVRFAAESLSRATIPCIRELTKVFSQCGDYWSADPKAKEFFDRAVTLASAKQIETLRISDFNTTGVIGDDDDRIKDKNWYSLIRSSGTSSKNAGEGGSYGIGKNAPFAASNLRTVLYSTNTGANKVAFQGVARLATHENSSVGKASHVGYLGGTKGESIRRLSEIPERFQRTERGTDVLILGFVTEKTWAEQLRYSVLENFWPAIHFGTLEVEIGNLVITKKNLAKLLEKSAGDEEFEAHHYYEAFVSPTEKFEQTLPHLKRVSVHMKVGSPDLPKQIAMVRKSGMVVYHKDFRAVVPFCGVFMCRNDKGNELLRGMEPPQHNVWDPDLPNKNESKQIAREFTDFIRQCIKQLATKDDTKVIDVPELSHLLPDDEDEIGDGGAEQSHDDKVEGFPSKPKLPKDRKELPVSKIAKRKPAIFDVDDEDDDEEEEEPGVEGKGKGRKKKKLVESHRQIIPLQYRAFALDPTGKRYALMVRPGCARKTRGMLAIQVVGDDTRELVRLNSAKLHGGKSLKFNPAGIIGPLALSRKPIRFTIEPETPAKIALEVTAYEAQP